MAKWRRQGQHLAQHHERLLQCAAAAVLSLFAAAPDARAQTATTERLIVSQFVERSMRTQVWFYHAFDEKCVLVRGFNVAVERLPKHGDVALDKVERIIDDSFINTRDTFANIQRVKRCFGRPMPVIVLSYTGKPGYSGFDDLQMVNTSADGLSKRLIEFRIGVR
jgi:hypothetical protein